MLKMTKKTQGLTLTIVGILVIVIVAVLLGREKSGDVLAEEGSSFNAGNGKDVKYGANDKWITRRMSGVVLCNNDTFGDPIYGVKKRCLVA